MCTYQTAVLDVSGSAKAGAGWFPVTRASVYFDHPVHAPAEHTLNVDLLNPGLGSAARAGIELDPGAARALAHAILAMLDAAPPGLVPDEPREVPEPDAA